MEKEASAKPIPWETLQDYLKLHEDYLLTLVTLEKTKMLKREEIEAKLPNAF